MTETPQENRPFSMTEHELAALTTLGEGDSGKISAQILGMSETRESDALVRAGMSTLVVRGLATLDDEGLFRPDGPATVIAGIMDSADDWLRIHYGNEEAEGVAVLIKAEMATLFVELHRSGIAALTPLDPSTDILQLTSAFLGATDLEAIIPAPFRADVTRGGADGEKTVIIAVGPNAWSLEQGVTAPPKDAWVEVLRELGYTD